MSDCQSCITPPANGHGSAEAWRDWSGIVEADRAARAPRPYVSRDGTHGYALTEGDVTVAAVPYRWDGEDRWQVYVRCDCPAGLHAFPTDTLDKAFDRGFDSCRWLADHHRARQRKAA